MNGVWLKNLIGILFLAGAALLPGSVTAYEVLDVRHGGTVEGTVTLTGEVPEPKGFNLITFPDPAYCGRISNGRGWRLLHDFVVDSYGGIEGCHCVA